MIVAAALSRFEESQIKEIVDGLDGRAKMAFASNAGLDFEGRRHPSVLLLGQFQFKSDLRQAMIFVSNTVPS